MQSETSQNLWIQRTKWLTQALIISGALNIGFLATFVYFTLKQKQHSLAIEGKPLSRDNPLVQETNAKLLRAYSLLPFQELLLRLDHKELAEEGLARRDISLACLVAFHHFNLEKALGGISPQKRTIPFSNTDGQETIEVPVFPGLTDAQFLAISHFAKTEKWPLTTQGLFYEIQRSAADPTLFEAFYLAPEFHAVSLLFSKTGLHLQSEQIVDLLSEGDWKTLSQYTLQQRIALDLSPERRQAFLLDYLNQNSPLAAKLLLESDPEFCAKRLSDAHILTLLDLCSDKKPALETFCKELLTSPRTDAVCKRAALTLYAFSGETPPEPYEHALALQRFHPPVIATVQAALPEASPAKAKKRYHTIQSGDNLWKIARKYQVRVDDIMRVNHLETEKLRPGKQLEIPDTSK
ncbi:MAG: LysM peptidoglycan-binding domain-containing protein [Chlamydiota bacterium]